MMEQIELTVQKRSLVGKKTKRLRRSGLIPAILYGPRTEPSPLQVKERDLRLALDRAGTNHLIVLTLDEADEPRMTLAREVQRDVVTHSLLHVDFYEVVMTEKITADIPVTLVGESPIVARNAGLLVRGIDSVQVQCLPSQLLESIVVDVSVLQELEQAVLVEDLEVDEFIEILTNPEEVMVKVLPLRAPLLEELVAEEVEAAEVEVIGAGEERAAEPEEVLEEAREAEEAEQETEAD
jgi:large subunit ribosomal protein L25